MPFNPSRLTLARKRRGLSQIVLAERIGVSRRSVVGFESGEFPPSDETLGKIQSVLEFPVAFFYGEDLDQPTPDTASFRAMSKMTAAQRSMALGEGAIALYLSRWIETWFELPPVALQDLSPESSPETAAMALRSIWGWGEHPIKNMIHLLESKGVRIFSLSIEAREVDAFSMWKESTPFMFLNTQKSAEHSRFDAAHELGHLVLHRHGSPQGQQAEREADEFASAFLMPRASVLAHASKFATIETLIKHKHKWIVSLMALTHRLHTLNVLSDWHYRSLCIEISKRGYRQVEPEAAPHETSQVLPRVFAALREENIGKSQIAEQLSITETEVDRLIFGLAITSMQGGKKNADSNTKSNASLTLVN